MVGFDVDAARAALTAELNAQMLQPKWDGQLTEAQLLKMAEINAELFRQRKQATYRKARYGINNAIYASLIKGQNYSCATCRRHASVFKRGLVIDHNHDTGVVRGLLCTGCNTALGHVLEKPEVLRALANYLEYYAQK